MQINISFLTAVAAFAHGVIAAPASIALQPDDVEVLKTNPQNNSDESNNFYKHDIPVINNKHHTHTHTHTNANTSTNIFSKRTSPLLASLYKSAGIIGAGTLAYRGGRYLWDSWRERRERIEQEIEDERKKREEIKDRYIRGD